MSSTASNHKPQKSKCIQISLRNTSLMWNDGNLGTMIESVSLNSVSFVRKTVFNDLPIIQSITQAKAV